jgi:hypothetical protein
MRPDGAMLFATGCIWETIIDKSCDIKDTRDVTDRKGQLSSEKACNGDIQAKRFERAMKKSFARALHRQKVATPAYSFDENENI